jgi:hypothetical protein
MGPREKPEPDLALVNFEELERNGYQIDFAALKALNAITNA